MTAVTIYPSRTGMKTSLSEISLLVGSVLAPERVAAHPQDALEMFRQENLLRLAVLRQADLIMARRIVQAHLDIGLLHAANALARREYRAAGGELRLRHRGWKRVRLVLRNGLVLYLHTPYLRPHHPQKKKRKNKKIIRGKAGTGIFPMLDRLGLSQRVTPALREASARQVTLADSLTEAQKQLKYDGVCLDRETLVHLAVVTGRVLTALQDRELHEAITAPLPATSELEGRHIQVSIDGGRSRTRTTDMDAPIGKNKRRPFETDWREPRLVTLTVLNDKGEQDENHRPIYLASLGNADAVMDQVVGLLRRLGAHLARRVVFISDGADWIWRRLPDVIARSGLCLSRTRCVLDFWHACEYVMKVLKLCRNFTDEDRTLLYQGIRQRLRDQDDGFELMMTMLGPLARGRRSKAIQKHLKFLSAHRAHMKYAQQREEKLPIGSGVVESAVRRVVNLRFKSASMFWRDDHLEPLLQVRALIKAQRWDDAFEASLQGRSWFDNLFSTPEDQVIPMEEAA